MCASITDRRGELASTFSRVWAIIVREGSARHVVGEIATLGPVVIRDLADCARRNNNGSEAEVLDRIKCSNTFGLRN